jgi:hypothetical protein
VKGPGREGDDWTRLPPGRHPATPISAEGSPARGRQLPRVARQCSCKAVDQVFEHVDLGLLLGDELVGVVEFGAEFFEGFGGSGGGVACRGAWLEVGAAGGWEDDGKARRKR